MDAGIISAAQKVEHYEIASYGTLRAFARTRGDRRAAEILDEILAEEKDADKTLTRIAEASINARADGESGEMDEDEEDEEEKPQRAGSPQARGRGNGSTKPNR